jgi:hypothetical protein
MEDKCGPNAICEGKKKSNDDEVAHVESWCADNIS